MGRRTLGTLERADLPQYQAVTGPPAPGLPATRRSQRPHRSQDPSLRVLALTRGRRWPVAAVAVALAGAAVLVGMNGAEATVVTAGTLPLRPGTAAAAVSAEGVTDGTGRASFHLPRIANGGGVYFGLQTRATATGSYLARVRVYADGSVIAGLSKTAGSTEQRFGDVRIAGLHLKPGSVLTIEARTAGATPVKLAVRAWVAGSTVPGWQYSAADTRADRITRSGTYRPWGYLSTSDTGGAYTLAFSGVTWTPETVPVPPASAGTKTTTSSHPASTPASNPAPVTTSPSFSSPAASSPPPATGAAPGTFTTGSAGTPDSTPSGAPSTATPASSPPATPASSGPAANSSTPVANPAPVPGAAPDATTTGVPAGTKLTVHDGDLTITKAGTVIDGVDVHGFIHVQAPDVTIRRSVIRGGTIKIVPGGDTGVITATDSAVRNLVVEDSEILQTAVSPQVDGIIGGNFTLRRVEVNGGVDTVKVFKNNVTIDASWLHGTQLQTDPYSGQKTHNDGVQVLGGTTIKIANTRIEGADNSAIMVSQEAAATVGLDIQNNWLDGGGCTVNIVPKDLDSIGPIVLADNLFGHDTRVANCPVARTASTTLEATHNLYQDSGQAIKINIWN
jgi:hypothetical protein